MAEDWVISAGASCKTFSGSPVLDGPTGGWITGAGGYSSVICPLTKEYGNRAIEFVEIRLNRVTEETYPECIFVAEASHGSNPIYTFAFAYSQMGKQSLTINPGGAQYPGGQASVLCNFDEGNTIYSLRYRQIN